jgi:uncharacterized protein YeaO (DUF488 family)
MCGSGRSLMAAKSRVKRKPARPTKAGARKPRASKPPARKVAAQKRKARGAGLIKIKRAYDPPAADDGLRILIDRLWPRGMPKAKLKLDAWVKHLAPSNGLRKWYQHDGKKFAEFRSRYIAELQTQGEGLDELRHAVKGRTVTLLTATRELDLSHATVLRDLLR